ncbi:hypothetical protein MNBD_NITROSPINAE02-1540 [hydrothermal vent metagenome]|uniref:Arabinogalactan endo-beta-1,4-galactanase n=1 Tax=hydrothermal vent metagenome TaxID=652676 RepID=A0A3B1BMX9_9ZZZZ
MRAIKNVLAVLTFIIGAGLLASCDIETRDEQDNGGRGSRGFALGFTDFPHALTSAAGAAAFSVIERDGDMAAMHFDDGVPWQKALDGSPYPQKYLDELNGKAAAIPPGHLTYLAVTPVSFSRDRLAENRGAAGSEPLPPPWNGRSFDHPQVIEAFINHCEKMISIYSPRFFAYAIEPNMLIDLAPASWDGFVTLAQSVYTSLKTNHPNLPIFLSLQADWFYKNQKGQRAGIAKILPFTDFIALSGYPFADQADPNSLATDYFSQLANLAPEKPFAIAETAWPAENITTPYPVVIPASDATQKAYMELLMTNSDNLSASFVVWFFTRDFDDFWESDLQYNPVAPTIRLWKDTGLYDGRGNARPALAVWRKYLGRKRK